jgi:hypothetical protein
MRRPSIFSGVMVRPSSFFSAPAIAPRTVWRGPAHRFGDLLDGGALGPLEHGAAQAGRVFGAPA